MRSLSILAAASYSQDISEAEKDDEASRFRSSLKLVHFGDLIEVDVVGSSEFDWRGKISPEGFLEAPLYDSQPVFALCRKTEDIASDVKNALKKFLNDPTIVVRILDTSNRPLASITGSISNPQRFRLKRAVRLKEIIVLSGGFAEDAGREI